MSGFSTGLATKVSVIGGRQTLASKFGNQSFIMGNASFNSGGPAYNIRALRDMEEQSSTKIQALARSYFTRKWYVNYTVRKRLSVPFSGLEFAGNPFLR